MFVGINSQDLRLHFVGGRLFNEFEIFKFKSTNDQVKIPFKNVETLLVKYAIQIKAISIGLGKSV